MDKRDIIKNAASAATLCEYIVLNGVNSNWAKVEESMGNYTMNQKENSDLAEDWAVLLTVVGLMDKNRLSYEKDVFGAIKLALKIRESLWDIISARALYNCVSEEGDTYVSLPNYDYVSLNIYYDEEQEAYHAVGDEYWFDRYYDGSADVLDVLAEAEEEWSKIVDETMSAMKERIEEASMDILVYKEESYDTFMMLKTEAERFGLNVTLPYPTFKGDCIKVIA